MAKFLITSALPYVNGVKHLGNLAGSLLPADIHARFRRQTGHEVLFLCGTDEHGTPSRARRPGGGRAGRRVLRAPARAAGRHLSPLRPVVRSFLANLGRRQPAADAGIFRHLDAAGLSSSRALIRQAYSPTDRRFLPDRYVVGTCPHCGSPNARGDQCESLHAPARPRRPRLAALGDFRRDRYRVSRDAAPVPETVGARGPAARWIDDATRLAAAGALDRNEMARRRPAGPLHHARSRPGACRCPSRASRTRSSMSGSTRRSATSPRRSNGARRARDATGAPGGRAATTCTTCSSSPRTTCPSTPSAFPRRFSARVCRSSCRTSSRASTG